MFFVLFWKIWNYKLLKFKTTFEVKLGWELCILIYVSWLNVSWFICCHSPNDMHYFICRNGILISYYAVEIQFIFYQILGIQIFKTVFHSIIWISCCKWPSCFQLPSQPSSYSSFILKLFTVIILFVTFRGFSG